MNSILYPIQGAEVDGARLVEIWALRNPTSVNTSWYKNIGRTISERSHSQAVDMARLCSHGKEAGFIQKANWKGKRGKNELKRIKGCMQFRKISVCGVMIVKAMK